MTDVARLLEESDGYADDSFEDAGAGGAQNKTAVGSVASALASAAAAVDKEDRAEAKAALEQYSKKLNVTSFSDPVADAAADDEDDDSDDDKENLPHSILLQAACYRGDMRKAQTCLEKGASPKFKDRHGWNSLHFCSAFNSYEIMRLLIKRASSDMTTRAFRRFINGHASDTGWTPLHVAVVKGSIECITLLLDNPMVKKGLQDLLLETAAECLPAEKSKKWDAVRRALGVQEMEPAKARDEEDPDDGGGGEGEGKYDEESNRFSKK